MIQLKKRHITAWVLLSVFVPMLLLASLHVHRDLGLAGNDCVECVNHQPHAGHITDGTVNLHECVLCQLLTFSYLAASAPVSCMLAMPVFVFRLEKPSHLYLRAKGSKSNRAPPFLIEH